MNNRQQKQMTNSSHKNQNKKQINTMCFPDIDTLKIEIKVNQIHIMMTCPMFITSHRKPKMGEWGRKFEFLMFQVMYKSEDQTLCGFSLGRLMATW